VLKQDLFYIEHHWHGSLQIESIRRQAALMPISCARRLTITTRCAATHSSASLSRRHLCMSTRPGAIVRQGMHTNICFLPVMPVIDVAAENRKEVHDLVTKPKRKCKSVAPSWLYIQVDWFNLVCMPCHF